VNQGELLDRHALVREIAGMHVQAIGAVVDLRDAQIDKLYQLGRQSALHDIAIHTTEGLGAVRRDLIIVQGHVALPLKVI
jgi:hypothetical protein